MVIVWKSLWKASGHISTCWLFKWRELYFFDVNKTLIISNLSMRRWVRNYTLRGAGWMSILMSSCETCKSTMWLSSHLSMAYLCMSRFIKLYTSSYTGNDVNLYNRVLKTKMARVYSIYTGVEYNKIKIIYTCLFK